MPIWQPRRCAVHGGDARSLCGERLRAAGHMTVTPAIYRVHHIERLPLRTPYPAQVARVQYLKRRLPREATLVIDDGGSRGVGDMFVDAGLDPIRVSIVHGMDVHWKDRRVTVPKSTLVSMLVARLHSGELAVHESLKDWPVLRRELLNFRPETTRTGVETWNARSGEHDDLVLSLAMAIWYFGNPEKWAGLLRYYALEAGLAGGSQWVLSMDIGQSVDPSAITIVEKVEHPSQADMREEFRLQAVGRL